MLLCRVILGRVRYCGDRVPDVENMVRQVLSGEFDSVLGDRERTSGTYREFIVYDERSVYPAYVLWYRRDRMIRCRVCGIDVFTRHMRIHNVACALENLGLNEFHRALTQAPAEIDRAPDVLIELRRVLDATPSTLLEIGEGFFQHAFQSADPEAWTCHHCSFRNNPKNDKCCEACSRAKGGSSKLQDSRTPGQNCRTPGCTASKYIICEDGFCVKCRVEKSRVASEQSRTESLSEVAVGFPPPGTCSEQVPMIFSYGKAFNASFQALQDAIARADGILKDGKLAVPDAAASLGADCPAVDYAKIGDHMIEKGHQLLKKLAESELQHALFRWERWCNQVVSPAPSHEQLLSLAHAIQTFCKNHSWLTPNAQELGRRAIRLPQAALGEADPHLMRLTMYSSLLEVIAVKRLEVGLLLAQQFLPLGIPIALVQKTKAALDIDGLAQHEFQDTSGALTSYQQSFAELGFDSSDPSSGQAAAVVNNVASLGGALLRNVLNWR